MERLNLIRLELYNGRKSLLVWTAIIGGFMAMLTGFTKIIISNKAWTPLLDSYPKAILDAFNFNPASLTTFIGWISSEPYMFLALLLGAYAATLASTAVAREVDQKTGEFLFVLPSSRLTIFFAKAIAHLLLITAVFVAATLLISLIGWATIGSYDLSRLLSLLLTAYLIALGAAGVGYGVTALIDGERTALSVGVGFIVLSFLLNGLAGLAEEINWLADLSIFHAFDLAALVSRGTVSWGGISICLALYTAGLALGGAVMRRKEMLM